MYKAICIFYLFKKMNFMRCNSITRTVISVQYRRISVWFRLVIISSSGLKDWPSSPAYATPRRRGWHIIGPKSVGEVCRQWLLESVCAMLVVGGCKVRVWSAGVDVRPLTISDRRSIQETSSEATAASPSFTPHPLKSATQ